MLFVFAALLEYAYVNVLNRRKKMFYLDLNSKRKASQAGDQVADVAQVSRQGH